MNAGEKMAAGNNAAEGRLAGVPVGGLAGWLLSRFRSGGHRQPRLALLERIALAPRQSLALVEAEGRRFLVATSPEGAPAFYALDERAQPNGARPAANRQQSATRPAERVSW
ncbi:MAG: flagellar biosynthetic protein FliO [Terracidiphilus sp.]|jgi:flagellar biogenesis protein FliO